MRNRERSEYKRQDRQHERNVDLMLSILVRHGEDLREVIRTKQISLACRVPPRNANIFLIPLSFMDCAHKIS